MDCGRVVVGGDRGFGLDGICRFRLVQETIFLRIADFSTSEEGESLESKGASSHLLIPWNHFCLDRPESHPHGRSHVPDCSA